MVILWKVDQFQRLREIECMLSETPDQFGTFGWDGACGRIALWTALESRAGQKFFIVNTADHMGEKARLDSHLMVDLAKELTDDGKFPLILMGDFNAHYDSPELKPLFDYFQHVLKRIYQN